MSILALLLILIVVRLIIPITNAKVKLYLDIAIGLVLVTWLLFETGLAGHFPRWPGR